MTPINFTTLLSRRREDRENILCMDIETFPMRLYGWAMFNQNFSVNQIEEDWALMSFSAEWLHDDGNFYADNRYCSSPKDDHRLLVLLHQLFAAADFIVARNGKKFDLRKIKARMAVEGFRPVKTPVIIDPMLLNRDEFAFSSQKLEYTTSVVQGVELRKASHGKYPGFELWKACLANDQLAWQECEDYNRIDVVSMKSEYLLLRGWYRKHPNVAIYADDIEGPTCGTCGSKDVKKDGKARTQVGIYQRYKCNCCGASARGRQLIANKEDRAHVLVNA